MTHRPSTDTFDVYLRLRSRSHDMHRLHINRVLLLDFNPVIPETVCIDTCKGYIGKCNQRAHIIDKNPMQNPLLFSWEELFQMATDRDEVRVASAIVAEQPHIQGRDMPQFRLVDADHIPNNVPEFSTNMLPREAFTMAHSSLLDLAATCDKFFGTVHHSDSERPAH